jgi:hypothetical protein
MSLSLTHARRGVPLCPRRGTPPRQQVRRARKVSSTSRRTALPVGVPYARDEDSTAVPRVCHETPRQGRICGLDRGTNRRDTACRCHLRRGLPPRFAVSNKGRRRPIISGPLLGEANGSKLVLELWKRSAGGSALGGRARAGAQPPTPLVENVCDDHPHQGVAPDRF